MYLLLFLSLAVYVACFFGIRSNVEQSLSLLVASLLVIYAFILWCINSKVFIPKNDMNLKVDMKIFFGYGINRFICMFVSSIILIQWMHHIHVVIEANEITNIQVILLGVLGFFYLLYAAYQILGEHTQIFFSKIPYVHKRWMKAVMIFLCCICILQSLFSNMGTPNHFYVGRSHVCCICFYKFGLDYLQEIISKTKKEYVLTKI